MSGKRSSRCAACECVEVELGEPVRVWQTNRPDLSIKIPGWQWRGLLERIKAEESINWDGVFFPLGFTADEIEAFVKGVLNGEFDLEEER